MENESWQSCPMCGRDDCDGFGCVDTFEPFVQLLDEPDEPAGWWGPWVLWLVLAAGSIVLWHLLGAPVWEGGF